MHIKSDYSVPTFRHRWITASIVLVLLALASGDANSEPIAQDWQGVSVHGEWAVRSQVDPIDDQLSIMARTEADDASVTVICRDGERLELLFVFDYEHIDDPTSFIFRVDREETFQRRLPVHFSGSWSRASLELIGLNSELPGSKVEDAIAAAGLIQQARAGSRLAVRTYDSSSMEVTKLFSLSGFTAASDKVFEHCGYDPDPDRYLAERERRLEALASEHLAMYDAVDAELGEEYRVTARFGRTMASLYTHPAGAPNQLITYLPTEPGIRVQVLRRYRSSQRGDTWYSFWYLVEILNGRVAWVSSSYVEEIR